MNLWNVFPLIVGYERIGQNQVRLYVEGPKPVPSFTRRQGVRTALFHLYAGRDAEAVLAWLAQNRAWQELRVPPPYTADLGVRAVLAAADWNCGDGSALSQFARTRVIESETHRLRLQSEVRLLIESVLENPARPGELDELQAIEDVVNAAPAGVELVTSGEIVDTFFGSEGTTTCRSS